MSLVAVIIPIYKSLPSEYELISLRQCCRVLKNYTIVLIAPESLNTQIYDIEFRKQSVNCIIERFANVYFESITGYNRLMLSNFFYNRFINYNYILIYQLDAYVFRDELTEWCNKKYDYIGAPLIEKFEGSQFSEKMRVGNGGFSLRKVKTYIQFFESKKNVFTPKQIAKQIAIQKKPHTRIFVWMFMVMGWRNKPLSCAKNWKYNEDDFWSGFLEKSNYTFNKPSPQEALNFAFERFPKECYHLTGRLSFGCHAWEKYEYDNFWKNFIK